MTEEQLLDDLKWLEEHLEALDPKVVQARAYYNSLQAQFNHFHNERNTAMLRLMEFRHGQSNNQ